MAILDDLSLDADCTCISADLTVSFPRNFALPPSSGQWPERRQLHDGESESAFDQAAAATGRGEAARASETEAGSAACSSAGGLARHDVSTRIAADAEPKG